MDVLLIYCDSRSPSRYLRYLDTGIYHQVLADSQIAVSSVLLHADRRPDEVIESFCKHPAKLVAFNLDEFNAASSFEVIGRLRTEFPDTPIAVFGVYTVLAPDRIVQNQVDYLVIGEGEIALYELAAQVVRGGDGAGVKNVWRVHKGHVERNQLRPLHDNVDMLPYADRSLFEQEPCEGVESERVLYVTASRGCPHECLFCYSPVVKKVYEGKGAFYRLRSVPHVAGEILGELRRHEYTSVTFLDEMFPLEKSWLRQLGQRIGGEHAITFQATVASEKLDEEMLDLLYQAGCRRIQLGIETGNDAFRRRVATRNVNPERLQRAVSGAKERGISVVASAMIGLPLESEELAKETCSVVQSLGVDEIQCNVYQPIVGTNLHQYSVDKQYLVVGDVRPDFTNLTMGLPELSPDVVRKYLYRMHFLNVVTKLRSLPPSEGYHDFIADLPRAKFRLSHSRAVDVGTAHRGSQVFGYLSIESGSDCRFAVDLRGGSFLRFSLLVPQASGLRMQHANTRLIAEVIWIGSGGERPMYYRAFSAGELVYLSRWQECIAPGPPDDETGEMMFRVTCDPKVDAKANVLWGAPVLVDMQGITGTPASLGKMKAEYEAKLAEKCAEIEGLKRDLEESRRTEHQACAERDDRARRVGELQLRIVDLENQLRDAKVAYAGLESAMAEKQAGLGGKLKGMFKK